MATRNPNPIDANQASNYVGGADVQNFYEFNPGVCILPLAEDPPTDESELSSWSPIVKIQLHAPYRVRTVKYHGSKDTNPPVMPSPQDAGAFVFMGGTATFHAVLNQSYLGFNWECGTVYQFVENRISRIQDGCVLGSPPWQWESTAQALQIYPTVPVGQLTGAIANSGKDAIAGVGIANSIQTNSQGDLPAGYFYNVPGYYPGIFFNDYMVNGGVPVQPQSQS